MATKTLDDSVFWNGLLMEKPSGMDSGFGLGCPGSFPSELPYDMDSPVESSLSSTTDTTESGDDEPEEGDEEEDFLAELTRRLTRSLAPEPQKPAGATPFSGTKTELWAVSGSPKSTLSGLSGWLPSHGGGISRNGSPNGGSTAPSPPTTPFGAETAHPNWDLIYAAAGHVARLRLTGEGAKTQPRQQQPVGGPVYPIKSHSLDTAANKIPHYGFCSAHNQTNQNVRDEQMLKSCSPVWTRTVKMNSFTQQNQQIRSRVRGIPYESNSGRCGAGQPLGLPQSAWPSLHARNAQQNQNGQNLRSLFLNGSGSMKERAGTGVFLPRRYENPAPEPRKKSGCSTVLLPAKVVQALNLNLDDMNAHSQHRFSSDYDVIMARRNALLAQQKRSLHPDGGMTHEVRLPQEWTY
ncbi:uncharacterized protein LOC116189322 isoform X2 [Punica granatum]|uniref:Uncharacterized protein LOC116189322 isoform X2 n=1 Tax=Punica granatum TaxID=22663 RepID=A0A6P8BWQ6_PUNGR|nr:uncharacterized protein LOC116189322 isoform X2 [Punica granatum]